MPCWVRNSAGKSTLMSVLFGLYQPEEGKILKNGKEVAIRNPNDANGHRYGPPTLQAGGCFSVLDNIILGVEPSKLGFLQKAEARKKVVALSEKYGLRVDPDALISDISVGMQQRVEILKMLYRDNEILIFDEPTAVLTPQEIDELMEIMRGFRRRQVSLCYPQAPTRSWRSPTAAPSCARASIWCKWTSGHHQGRAFRMMVSP